MAARHPPAGSPYNSDRKYNNGRPATPLAGRFFAGRMKSIPLSPGRRLMADLSWASLRVPRCVLTVRLEVPRCCAARAALAVPRPPWTTLFLKAFAQVSAAQPALRRAYAAWPRPHLVEAEHPVGCIVLHREAEGMLGFARIQAPDRRPLPELAALLDHAARAPLAQERRLRNMRRFAGFPWPLRRLALLVAMALAKPVLRAGGTFAISTLGSRGVDIVDSVSILPCFLTYGPIGADGGVQVHLCFDHRVIDGADGAIALAALQAALEGPVTDELRALARPAPHC